MPQPAYISITGTKQGLISKGAFTSDSVGNIWQEGHEDECIVQAFSSNVIIPRDPQSGQPTGSRVHQPATITKYQDKASPLLWQALSTGEVLSEVTLSFWRTSTAGQQEKYFTIKWEDAVLVDGKGMIPNVLMSENSKLQDMEEWAFTYRKVTWTHEKAGTSGSDDWRKTGS
ncbi:Hcp family type VI secretion system effector [Xanthobacter agilis]|uniref:Type VI secretion system secreted protein Hcp n=1 Tax=Xanthobacter agilis TaxID=47492 RepID=A0ABU0LES8_XANAG|nr:Hcp family type VI secretion system effector [Xanthobacter agilis]MDQ0505575.1 type VI secretion system secreted protein Hcp [Xanthobacter agilis]